MILTIKVTSKQYEDNVAPWMVPSVWEKQIMVKYLKHKQAYATHTHTLAHTYRTGNYLHVF